jgi:phosphoglycolate phosphatase-like HAD superfamily hydrolase
MSDKKLIIFDFYGTLADSNDQIYSGIRKCILSYSVKYAIAVCSSMESGHLRRVLENEGLTQFFSDILGSDVSTSKVVKIQSLLKKYGHDPKDALFVTDTLGDIREGVAAGVACIGVTWGTQDKETLEKGNPLYIVNTVPELEEAIERFFMIQ